MKDKIKLIISLLKLVRPFLMIMLLAIILGVLGHLTATFITVFIILAFFICFVYDRDNFYWTDLNLFSQRGHV